MSVLCVNVCRLCMSLSKIDLVKFGAFAWYKRSIKSGSHLPFTIYSDKIRVICSVRFERQKVDKKQGRRK